MSNFELDVDELNARWSNPDNIDSWGQLVIKHTADTVELITQAPATGIWRLQDDGSVDMFACKRIVARWNRNERRFSCASPSRVTTSTKEPTWASSSPLAA